MFLAFVQVGAKKRKDLRLTKEIHQILLYGNENQKD